MLDVNKSYTIDTGELSEIPVNNRTGEQHTTCWFEHIVTNATEASEELFNATALPNVHPLEKWLEYMTQLQIDLYVYLSPVLIIVGTCGNMMSLLILRSSYFSKSPCSVLLCMLSVVDTGVLLTGLLRVWIMETFNQDIRVINTVSCRAHYFLTYVLQHLSSWTVVMVTIERFVSVYSPFRAKQLCSKGHLMRGMAAVLAMIILLNVHVLFTLQIVHESYIDSYGDFNISRCGFNANYYYGNSIWPWVDYVILAFVPFVVLLVGNMMIVVKVVSNLRSRKLRHQHVSCDNQRKRIRSLTMMMFAVTGTFLVTVTPYEIYLIGMGHDYWDIQSPEGMAHTMTANVVCELVFYINNSVTFLMYCVSGSRFRIALNEYFRRPLSEMRPVRRSVTHRDNQRRMSSAVFSRCN